jgi:hypothetical protein
MYYIVKSNEFATKHLDHLDEMGVVRSKTDITRSVTHKQDAVHLLQQLYIDIH